MRREFAVVLMFGTGVTAFGQTTPVGLVVRKTVSIAPPVRNAPYSAVVQQGTENARISREFRDSEGRQRTETSELVNSPGGPQTMIRLTFPAESRQCLLDTTNNVAHCFSSIPIRASSKIVSDGPPEDLGTKTIEGVQAEGKRYTETFPNQAGKAAGRVRITEVWNSVELGVFLRTEISDTVTGKAVTILTNLRREEPDAKLFEIGADYQVVEEPGNAAGLFGAPTPAPLQPLPAGASRPGNGVSQPKLITKVPPKYTKEASRAKIEGTVTLRIVVSAEGRATQIEVVKSLDPGLDQEAINAVEQWRFEPGQKDGKPVAVLASIEVNFRILDKPPSN